MIRPSSNLTRGLRQMGLMGGPMSAQNDSAQTQAQSQAFRPASDDVTAMPSRANGMRTGQAFQSAARQASMQASAMQGPQALANTGRLGSTDFNPMATNQVGAGGQRQAAGLFDDLANMIGNSGPTARKASSTSSAAWAASAAAVATSKIAWPL
jgi:hypothetical protein